jgi:hypothetical protein
VPTLVAGPDSAWPVVTVSAEGRSAELPADLRRKITPLLGTRALERPAPLGEYGLDRPVADLSFHGSSGQIAVVVVGNPNFDRHFVYAQRRGRATVYLVPADALRPVLALVGIDVRPPD